MDSDAQRLISDLGLRRHPEGGWYRETYRSRDLVLTPRGASRAALTVIYYLLDAGEFSAFHRIASDEAWHFYRGAPITIEIIMPDGRAESRTLGPGGPWHTVVSAGATFAAHADGGFALVGCDVAPGFDFADFVLTSRAMLLAAYPQHAPLIARYTR